MNNRYEKYRQKKSGNAIDAINKKSYPMKANVKNIGKDVDVGIKTIAMKLEHVEKQTISNENSIQKSKSRS